MDILPETYNIQRLNHEETENMSKNWNGDWKGNHKLPTNPRTTWIKWWILPNFQKILPKFWNIKATIFWLLEKKSKMETSPNIFYEVNINLIWEPKKETIREIIFLLVHWFIHSFLTISLINVVVNILNKILANQVQQPLEGSYTMTNWDLA